MPGTSPRLFTWEFYETPNGRKLVREEIHALLTDKAALVALGPVDEQARVRPDLAA